MDGVSDHEPRKGKPVSIWILMLQMSLRKRGNQLGSSLEQLSMTVWEVILVWWDESQGTLLSTQTSEVDEGILGSGRGCHGKRIMNFRMKNPPESCFIWIVTLWNQWVEWIETREMRIESV